MGYDPSMSRPAPAFEQSLMQELCRYIETHSGQPPTLQQLARQAQLSPAYLQRRFKAAIGVTPKEYADACRMKKLKQNLRETQSVTHAIYDSGFASNSRVYERIDTHLGMTPKQYCAQGKNVAISYASAKTPIGLMMMAATERGLCFIQFGDSAKDMLTLLRDEYPEATLIPMKGNANGQFAAWMQALSNYLRGNLATLDLPLDIRGTAFQRSVWKYLQTIPSGNVQSYSEVAAAIGAPKAVRAVASACARNRLAIVIPCHRVLRGDGTLAGFRWGLERKRALIAMEKKS